MFIVPKSNIYHHQGETYVRDLHFPGVATFLRLNVNLMRNNMKTLHKLAKGLGISGYSLLRKGELVEELNRHIRFNV